tara:strand:- start:5156 stop:5527 length:372 start_codon:yes stop_codon:yes gene_type:complete
MTKEIDIQIACNYFLIELSKKYKFRHFHVPNEGKRKPQYQIKLKKMGLRKGCPDFVIEYPKGKLIYIELKNEKGSLSNAQKLWLVQSSCFKTPHFILKGNIKKCLKELSDIIVKYVPSRKNTR